MSGDHYGVGDRYLDHAGYRPGPPAEPSGPPEVKPVSPPPPAPSSSRLRRCPSRHPQLDEVQCIHLQSSPHRIHTGWNGEVKVEWPDPPTGPRTVEEWHAVAWACTDGLGVELFYDPGDRCIRVRHDAIADWWDRQTAQYKMDLLNNWRNRRTV